MNEVRTADAAKPAERGAGLTVALIGLLAAVSSAILPWLLSRFERPPASGSAVVAAASAAAASHPWPDLMLGVWQIEAAVDEEGTDFSGSTLRFTSQTPSPTGVQLEGFFEWRGDDLLLGREFFRADLDAVTRQLFVQGCLIQDYVTPPRLAVGAFTARLSPDGRELTDGTWGSTPGRMPGVAGDWSAKR